MTVSAPGTWYNSGDDRGNDADIVISGVSSPASGTFLMAVTVHQHQGTETVTGITWGATGATFTECGTYQGPNGRRVSIWRSADCPANTTADVTVTLSGNNRPKGAAAGFYTSDTGDISMINPPSNTFDNTGTAITGTVNPAAANHELLACCVYGSGGGSVAPGSGVNEFWDLDASGPGADSDYWAAGRPTTGTGAHTIDGTISGTSGWAMIICEITDDAPPAPTSSVLASYQAFVGGT